MLAQAIQQITIEDALARLKKSGCIMSRDYLCNGLMQGKFPFGEGVEFPNCNRYTVYLAPLERWIDSMSGDVYVPDPIPQPEEVPQ